MYTQELLNTKVAAFIHAQLSQKYLAINLANNLDRVLSVFKKELQLLNASFRNKGEKEYALKHILAHLVEVEYVNLSIGGISYLDTKYENGVLSRSKSDLFAYNKQMMIDYLVIVMENDSIGLIDEDYTNVEFEDLKTKLSHIAQSIFEFQKRQEVANEVIYNSVEEIKVQLIKDAEKGRIFGKEFVKQQIVGKLLDLGINYGTSNLLSSGIIDSGKVSSLI